MVTTTATDAAGNSAVATFTVTVVDTTPPVISLLKVSKSVLYLPLHDLRTIKVTVVATDNLGATPVSKIVNVTSDEPISGLSKFDKSPDWQITGDLTLKLRAERDWRKPGRTYTIYVEARDGAGNATVGTVTVFVPNLLYPNCPED
jgi:hypothetical protein